MKIPMRLRPRSIAAASALLFACRLFPPERVSLAVPELPETWTAAGFVSGWSLEAAGRLERVVPGAAAELAADSGSVLPVFLRADVPGDGPPLKPLGTVWPHCLSAGALEATVAGGWVATVCSILLARDEGLAAAVDWARLEREVSARLVDPWALDPCFASRRLADGSFRVTDLDALERYPVSLADLPGVLVDESPAGLPLEPDAEGRAVVLLAPGVRRFLAPGLALTVSVNSDGRAATCLSAP